MSNDNVLDSIRMLFGTVQIRAVRVFLEQARRYSNSEYLTLEIYGTTLVVCGVDKPCDCTVLNPMYNGRKEEK